MFSRKVTGVSALTLIPLAGIDAQPNIEVSRPNIILIMADDMGWGDAGFNGNTVIRTPHLDRMARDGMRMERFYASSPVSSPTRGSCITGRHPYRYGIWSANEGHMRREEITIAEFLRDRGYATGHFGKWHLGTLDPRRTAKGENRNAARNYSTPGMNGFDEWFSTESSVQTWDPGTRNGKKNTDNPYVYNGVVVEEGLEGCDSKIIMDRAIPFIERSVSDGAPFLSVIWFHAPHAPVIAGPEFRKMYRRLTPEQQDFYGAITAMDVQVGRLRAELKRLGVDDNTLILFASDNGPEGLEVGGRHQGTTGGLRGRKRSLWEGGIRVPAIIEWPARVEAGSVASMPCSTLDYFPTIMEIFGYTLPNARPVDGISLLPLFDGRMTARPQPIPFETIGGLGMKGSGGSSRMAVIDNRYKYMTDLDGGEEFLYDLVSDPAEIANVIADHPEVALGLREALVDFRKSCTRSASGKDYPAGTFVPDKDDKNVNDRVAVKSGRVPLYN